MLVVDRRATGEDIVRMSTGFSEYRILADRPGTGGAVEEVSLVVSLLRFERNVNALDIDDMIIPPRDNASDNLFRLPLWKCPHQYQIQSR